MMFVVTAVLKLSWQSNVRNQLLMELQYDIYIYGFSENWAPSSQPMDCDQFSY